MASSTGYDYEVFLSFRGPDTRLDFTDMLYTSLIDAGIRTFRDDKELHFGEEFAPEFLQAMKQSKISIPIFSKGYASSVWCLREIAQMVECQKTGRQKIMPIFYDVAPSEVRHQTEDYGMAFRYHEKKGRYDEETISQWKAALSAVGAINGWDLQSEKNRREGEFAKTVTQEVFNNLKKAYLEVSDYLVSVDHHVDEIMQMIGAHISETRIIGIHGMGGVGKSTIAKIIYNQLSNNFQGCCFLSNIREMSESKGIEWLQHQLISDILKSKLKDITNIDEGTQTIRDRLSTKKVLIVLDDVDDKKQMDALLGKRNWFGRGSKLIITTRNKEVLKVPQVDDCYEVNCMDSIQSLQLFSKHAFRRDSPLDEYINQSNRAIGIAGGLPLALEVIGSLLSYTKKEKWGETLDELASGPPEDVESKLKISYGALRDREKYIFLDIACLFIGYDKDVVIHFWDESKFSPKGAMTVLENKSLIKIGKNNKVWMHDQLKDLGRAIVREKSDMKIDKQSRVWDPKEGLDLLRRHKGCKEVEALRLKVNHEWQHRFTYEGFESLSKLKFLEVNGQKESFCAEDKLLWHGSPSNDLEKSILVPQLRWLSWRNIPPTFNIANLSMENVVILNLSWSTITYDWKGWSLMRAMERLKVLDLSYCEKLESLPNELGRGLASLEYLSLKWCRSLKRLPNSIGELTLLIELNISFTSIEELPRSIGKLRNLKVVKMGSTNISKIPDAFWKIGKLEEVKASGKKERLHGNIGRGIYENKSLSILKLGWADIYKLPRLPESLTILHLGKLCMETFPDISNLTGLKELDLSFSRSGDGGKSNGLGEDWIPRWIVNLTKLESLSLDSHDLATVSTDLSLPPHLKSLRLYCPNLGRLPRLPSSLSSLDLNQCRSLRSMGDLSNLKNLSSLCLADCHSLRSMDLSGLKKLSSLRILHSGIAEIQGLGCLENLRELWLDRLEWLKVLPDLRNLNKLRSLHVYFCGNLVEIEGELPQTLEELKISDCQSLLKLSNLLRLPSSLSFLRLSNCDSLCSLEDLSNLKNLSSLEISSSAIAEIQGLGCFENLQDLRLDRLERVKKLPDLSNLSKLRSLNVYFCDNLVEIQGELPQTLEELEISYCQSLLKLPNLSSLKKLQEFNTTHWWNEPIPDSARRSQVNFWEKLRKLQICGLGQVEILPDLSNLNKLRSLYVNHCANLVEIQGELPQSLEELEISDCQSLRKLPDLSRLKELQKVIIAHCRKLKGEAILGSARRSEVNFWEKLRNLRICGLGQVEVLPDLSNLNKLRSFLVEECDNLVEIQGELPQSLEELEISDCESLLKLPDLSSLKELQKVSIAHCRKSKREAILGSAQRSQVNFWENINSCIYRNKSLRILNLRRMDIYALPRLPESLIKLQLSELYMDTFPDLSNLADLKELDLEFHSCDSDGESDGLVEYPLPKWIGNLSKLESLVLRCHFVTTPPTDLSLPPHLKALHLKCPNLRRLPRLPSRLSSLHLECCLSLCSMEDLSNLKKLSFLEIWQGAISEIPGLGCLENLRDLMLCGLGQVERLPDLSSLNKLRSLKVRCCDNLVEIQGELPRSLGTLVIQSCRSLLKLPNTSSLMDMQVLEISNCNALNVEAILGCARKNPRDLEIVGFDQLQILSDLSNLRKSNELRRLQVACCGNLVEIRGELPESLEILEIDTCESLRKLPDLSRLMELREVCIGECGNLIEIQCELPKSLEKLEIYFCKSLQKLPNLSSLMGLREVCIGECGNLVEIQGELPESLEELKISFCESLQKLPNMSCLMGLREFCIGECGSLVEIQGELPQSLENLEIRSCGSLQKLPDLSSLLGLREVCIEKCGNLVEIQGELPQSLEELKISFCKSLQKLPNLSSLKELRKVEIDRCRKLNMEAIASLCLEKSVEFVGEDDKSESEGEDGKSESEQEGEDEESESEGEDAKPETEYEGEDEE